MFAETTKAYYRGYFWQEINRGHLTTVLHHFVIFIGYCGVEQAYVFISVFVNAGVFQTAVFITAEFINRIVHQRIVKHAQTDQ